MIEKQKTLLMVTPYFLPFGGGLERYAYEVALRLSRDHKWRVVVITSGEYKGKDTEEDYNGILVYRLAYGCKFSNTPFSFSWFKKIRTLLDKEKPDTINVHTPVPGIGNIASMCAGNIPVIVTYHAGSMHKGKFFYDIFVWLYEHLFMDFLLKKARHIACSSDFVRFTFLGKYFYKSVTISPAVDSTLFTPKEEKKSKHPTVLFVAAGLNKGDQHKGLQNVLEAIDGLRKKIPAVRLLVVGDGDMRNEYESRAKNLGISEHVIFTGRLSGQELASRYQEAHVFVLPTKNESFSMAILEAMACEIPVIATNVGGVPKIVAHNETGILLAENSVDLLIEHLYELLTDEARAKAFGALARTKVLDNYSWEARANYFNAIFEKLKNNSLTASGKKIALVTPYFYPKAGGLENYALEMGRALKRTGHDVLVITSSHAKKGWVYEEIEGIRIYRMPILFKISNTPINFMWLLWIRNILGNEKPDIINAHTPVPFIADMAERVRGHTPFVLNYHNDLVKSDFIPSMLCKLEYFFLTNRTLRKSDMIIATSEYYAKRSPYLRKFYKKINFVPPGVDMTRFMLGLETPYFTSRFKDFSTVLFVGQLDRTHRHKGLSDLLVAISLLKEAVPTIKLIVVGRGNEIPVYKEEAKALGIEDSVSFEGFVSDELLPQYYAGADLLALPSRDEAEGFGMVITEAAACGTPSVATNVGGVPAALIDGVTGYLVPPSNPQVLSQKIKELLSDKEHAARLGHNAYERIKKDFSLPVVTSIFVDSISSLL